MEDIGIDYQKAKELVAKYISNDITRYHLLESEAIMKALAEHFYKNEASAVAEAMADKWGIIGLLHDIDWDLTKADISNHCIKCVEILKSAGGSDFLIETIQSHGYEMENHGYVGPKELLGKKRTTKIQHALAASETLTGLIVASVLVHPDKKLASVRLESLQKKFKNKTFAAKCNRDIILECEKIGLTLDEFLRLGLKALQTISSELGL